MRRTRGEVGAELARGLIAGQQLPAAGSSAGEPPGRQEALAAQQELGAGAAGTVDAGGIVQADFGGFGEVNLPSPQPPSSRPAAVAAARTHADLQGALRRAGVRVTLRDVAAMELALQVRAWAWLDAGADGGAMPGELALHVAHAQPAPGGGAAGTSGTLAPGSPAGEPPGLKEDRREPAAAVGGTESTGPAGTIGAAAFRAAHAANGGGEGGGGGAVDLVAVPLFATTQGGKIAPDIQRIAEVVFAVDASKDHADLTRSLHIGESHADYRTLMKALDDCEERALRAYRLYLGAKIELENWERDVAEVAASMREKAVAALEQEKAAKTMTKRIANADVEGVMATMFADEYAAQKSNRAKLKATVDYLERLADLLKLRCGTLSTMLSNLRK